MQIIILKSHVPHTEIYIVSVLTFKKKNDHKNNNKQIQYIHISRKWWQRITIINILFSFCNFRWFFFFFSLPLLKLSKYFMVIFVYLVHNIVCIDCFGFTVFRKTIYYLTKDDRQIQYTHINVPLCDFNSLLFVFILFTFKINPIFFLSYKNIYTVWI